jgi:alkylation response protein AidB-like acyl-CoA dehydrogenase
MSDYVAPLKDMQFVLQEIAPLNQLASVPAFQEVNFELASAILEEAGKFAGGVLSPLNIVGDREGCRWSHDEVRTAPGWRDAYRHFINGGWNALACSPQYGGQGLPRVVSALVEEMWNSANVAFALCPMLTHGAIEALELRGSDEQKRTWLPKLVSGEWTGTMNLTEPQAGSDLSAVRTKAVPQADGSYRIHGQKIFITYGEHDLTDNIVHLVLARVPGAPDGVKGISLFLVPKRLLDVDGRPATSNDVRCVSIEHKLGIHGSPTAVLAFGDREGAVGWLVGEENRGLETMFIMMNAARFSVGIEGVGLSERATQRAVANAKQRVQGTAIGAASRDKVAIVHHPDVRRMLSTMKARAEALRAVACVVALAMDLAQHHPDAAERAAQQAFVDLLIPVVKGWSTESAVEIASLGVQVHGGMGYVEETGAAQHLRDARITPIYEGTTGIQAADLVGRKIARDGGAAARALLARMRVVQGALDKHGTVGNAALAQMGRALDDSLSEFEAALRFLVDCRDPKRSAVGAVPFLELFGVVAGGWQMGAAALAAQRRLADGDGEATFLAAKIATARVYAAQVLPRASGLRTAIVDGADAVLAADDDGQW